MPNDKARQEAIRLLQHYLRVVWLKAGLQWDADNNAETEAIVDAIVEAAR